MTDTTPPPDDIAALVDHVVITGYGNSGKGVIVTTTAAEAHAAIDMLFAVKAPPPDDIAGLIEWLEGQANYLEETFNCFEPPPRKAAALRAAGIEEE